MESSGLDSGLGGSSLGGGLGGGMGGGLGVAADASAGGINVTGGSQGDVTAALGGQAGGQIGAGLSGIGISGGGGAVAPGMNQDAGYASISDLLPGGSTPEAVASHGGGSVIGDIGEFAVGLLGSVIGSPGGPIGSLAASTIARGAYDYLTGRDFNALGLVGSVTGIGNVTNQEMQNAVGSLGSVSPSPGGIAIGAGFPNDTAASAIGVPPVSTSTASALQAIGG